jgi:two-component system CheB/CheR fusion protein
MAEYFEPLSHKWKIYRSLNKRREFSPELEISKTRYAPGRLTRPNFLGPQPPMRFHEEERILDRLLESVSGDYVPLTMVVNDQLELLHVLGDSSGILKYPSGRVVNDISRIAIKDLSIPLSTGIQKAFKHQENVRYTNVRIHEQGVKRTLDLRIKPFPKKKGQGALAAVFVENNELLNGGDSDKESLAYDLDQEAAQRILDLEQELQFTRENLQATIEELETSNEELQATNEELLASNEELQSTNEELQSVNEELHTVNTEHQRKIMELTELNNDMHNFMEITGVGTMFLDENLELRKFTPKITKIFRIVDADIGRPVSHLPHRLSDVDIDAVIDEVVGTNQRIEKEVQAKDGNWYLLRAMPYAIGTEAFSGSIISFIDINELKKSQSSFRMLAENIKDVFWMRTPHNQKVVYVSPAYEKIWGRDIRALYKNPSAFIEAIHPEDRDRFMEQMERCADSQWEMDYRIQKLDGEVNWIHDRGFPVYGADGEVEMMCGFASDITSRKMKEDLCQISLSRFKNTFQDSEDSH